MTAVKRIAQVGLPSMLQQSLVSLSMMMMQGLVNTFGKVLVAGYTAATKIDTLACCQYEYFQCHVQLYRTKYRRRKI